jgi:hypothetical protein
MNDETALVLELVFHRGLLSREELEPLRRELSGHPDPLDELVRTKRTEPEQSGEIRILLGQFRGHRQATLSMVKENLLSGKQASELHHRQVESIRSGKMISLLEAARTLPIPLSAEAIRIDSKAPLPLYNRDMARRDLGYFAEARRDFEKALEVAPADRSLRASLLEDLDSLPQ